MPSKFLERKGTAMKWPQRKLDADPNTLSKDILKVLVRQQRDMVNRDNSSINLLIAGLLLAGVADSLWNSRRLILLIFSVLAATLAAAIAFDHRIARRRLAVLEVAIFRFRPPLGYRDPTTIPRDDLDLF